MAGPHRSHASPVERPRVIPSQPIDAPGMPQSGSVLRNSGFLRLWSAQVVSQTAQNGLMFALLVLITERSGSSTQGSLLVLAFTLPSVLFSIPAGVLVDRWHKRTVLIVTNACRAGMAVLFILTQQWVVALLGVTLCFSSISQFFGPAESSSIPALVPRRQLISANALFQLTLTGSQFLGLVVLAPALLKTGGADLFFGAMIVLYGGATALVASLPRGFEPELRVEPVSALGLVRATTRDVSETLRTIRDDRISLLALVQLTMSSSLAMLFGLLVPRYVRDVLDIAPDNAVFVFAPVAVGAVVGLRTLRWLTARLDKQVVVTIGLFGIAGSLLALAAVDPISGLVEQAGAGQFVQALGRVQPRFATFTLSVIVLVTMICAVPMGFFYALVNAPAQTIIHERAPADMRGRFFGTQLLLANCSSLVLLLVAGAAADALGVTIVLALYAPVVLGVAAYGFVVTHRQPPVLA
jgi:MFS family permease